MHFPEQRLKSKLLLASVIWYQEPSFWKRKDMFIISCKIIVAFRFPPNIWHSHTWHFCLKVVVPHFAQTVCWQCAPIKHSHRDLQRLCVWEGFLGFLQFYPAKQSCVYCFCSQELLNSSKTDEMWQRYRTLLYSWRKKTPEREEVLEVCKLLSFWVKRPFQS